jgi:DNA ligase-1
MSALLLSDVVETSRAVAATRSRLAKREALVGLLQRAEADDIEVAVAFLSGSLRQRRTGLGWASLRDLPEPAEEPTLTAAEVDATFEQISTISGAGSAQARLDASNALMSRATADERTLLKGLVHGELRQGALESSLVDAVAAASEIPLAVVRRAVMLRGAVGPVARAAMTEGQPAVEAFGLTVGQPVKPMLASTAPDMGGAFAKIADSSSGDGGDTEVCVDTKLDGIRIQVHKRGDQVSVYTRSLDDITPRLPEVVSTAAALEVDEAVLDGEAIALDDSGRPRPFQETSSRTATQLDELAGPPGTAVTPFFFDVLHIDGDDLIDLPLRDRLARLDAITPESARISRLVTHDVDAAAAFFTDRVAAGQEGVVVKDLEAAYEAGRRGAGWVKVKPRHTLDLVVLAIEWGSGRRKGWLSNIHMGARDPAGGFVMLGKTFKGMTDEMLAWQTERFTELALEPETVNDSYVVQVRPEQVVEIAFDGLQRSTRYPGGLALRFARVLRYRDDKTAEEADTIDTVRSLAATP